MLRIAVVLFSVVFLLSPIARGEAMSDDTIALPTPLHKGKVSVEEAIKGRRTIREFVPQSLELSELSQLLWAAQGITDSKRGFRSAPSGGALYPLDIYAVVGENCVEGAAGGVYWYQPQQHSLKKVIGGDVRGEIGRAALGQDWIAGAPVVFVITAEYQRITSKYGNRGIRYAIIEAGHVGQNIFLQAEALKLGAGIVGAFDDDELATVMRAARKHKPLLIMPVGHKK